MSIEKITINPYLKSYCRTEAIISKYEFTWTIAHFEELCQCDISLETPLTMHQSPCTFALCCQPKTNKCYFHIRCMADKESIVATYYVWICTTNGKEIKKIMRMQEIVAGLILYEYEISSLIENATQYLVNNTLTIGVRFEIFRYAMHNSIYMNMSTCHKVVENPLDFYCDKDAHSSNVTFMIEDKCLTVKKALLCSKSIVFISMFESGLEESKTNIVKITDIKYDTLSRLLSYIQTSVTPRLDDLTMEDVYELFLAADKYDIGDLREICERHLINNITIQNAVDLLQFTNICTVEKFRQNVREFCRLYIDELIQIPEFQKLINDQPELLGKIFTKTKICKQIIEV